MGLFTDHIFNFFCNVWICNERTSSDTAKIKLQLMNIFKIYSNINLTIIYFFLYKNIVKKTYTISLHCSQEDWDCFLCIPARILKYQCIGSIYSFIRCRALVHLPTTVLITQLNECFKFFKFAIPIFKSFKSLSLTCSAFYPQT